MRMACWLGSIQTPALAASPPPAAGTPAGTKTISDVVHAPMASANTHRILEGAALADLIEGCVDGDAMLAEHLRPKPAPDTLLTACRQLGVEPRHAAVFETSPSGIVAARTAGCALVIGVARTGEAKALQNAGADLVAAGLEEFLDRKLAA